MLPPIFDVTAGADQELANVRLALPDDVGDLLVVVIEHLTQQETARSTGVRLSRMTRNAIDSESAVSACCAASDAVSVINGSGSHVPT